MGQLQSLTYDALANVTWPHSKLLTLNQMLAKCTPSLPSRSLVLTLGDCKVWVTDKNAERLNLETAVNAFHF